MAISYMMYQFFWDCSQGFRADQPQFKALSQGTGVCWLQERHKHTLTPRISYIAIGHIQQHQCLIQHWSHQKCVDFQPFKTKKHCGIKWITNLILLYFWVTNETANPLSCGIQQYKRPIIASYYLQRISLLCIAVWVWGGGSL